MRYRHLPEKQGLYDPQFEHDSCGVGFVCDIKGRRSYDIVEKGITVLESLSHRGAVGADPETGDGAGILIQIPDKFFHQELSFELPLSGEYGVGLIFLPQSKKERSLCVDALEKSIKKEGQELIGWRDVPVDSNAIGVSARETEPDIKHLFIKKGKNTKTQLDFERKLYVIRRQAENSISKSNIKQKKSFYITNLSSKTLSYKGLLMPSQIKSFFLDLQDKRVESGLCLVHSRYSTNTFPTWDLAQPFRFLAHNGEINTLRGNINWMSARESLLKSKFFGKDIEKIKPIIIPNGSDSATLDNVFELLSLSGRSLPHAMMMLIPGAWENNKQLKKDVKDFYKYHACITEPWDGPAAVAFTDGNTIGAVLDRNGLRPARYIITKDGMVVMASEVGVLNIDAWNISVSGRLEPGKIFFIDTEHGEIIDDAKIKKDMSKAKDYSSWLKKNMFSLDDIKAPHLKKKDNIDDIYQHLKSFGYTREDVRTIIKPMAETGQEPIGAMGADIPHAVLSKNNQLLYNYFKQLFAQVTNPAIDPIREKVVMSLDSFIGPAENLLEETSRHCHRLHVEHPILTDEDLLKIEGLKQGGFKAKVLSTLFDPSNESNLLKSLNKLCQQTEKSIKAGYNFIILSDRGSDKKKCALPALLVMGAVHHHLIRKQLRTQAGVVIESGEPKEVHHLALLFGYGADCINPYMAFKAIEKLIDEKEIKIDKKKAIYNYIKASEKGILKILSKMGISTLQSYRGAQIFEAVGLNQDVIDKVFTGTVSRIGGIGFDVIAKETIQRHKDAYSDETKKELLSSDLESGGIYQWKSDGEFHLWNPDTISLLQDAVRKNDYNGYKEFAKLINEQEANPCTLRSVLKFKEQSSKIPIDKVEPVSEIVKRFATGAMSYGSISKEAHEMLAIAMNRLGGKSNTGEGGEDPTRFIPFANGDSKRSAIKQVASGRFGVTPNYLINADELQIKIAQGAKPGEGGQLPGHKVSAIIAKTRYTTPGVTLISPPPHHDIYSIEDLAQLIFDLKNANPRARISVKLVSEVGVGTIAAGVVKGHADMVLISGGDGGTGASPRTSIRHAGLPWELGLSETHQTLVLNDLRDRVRLQTDGQMRTGRDIAIAALLGAEEYGFCTATLIVMGCVMLRHCNLNNCSVGVATQDSILRRRFTGKAEYLEHYFRFVCEELREIMASLGISKLDNMIGRTDLLEANSNISTKAKRLDFSKILYKPTAPGGTGSYCQKKQDHAIDNVLDRELIRQSKPAIEDSKTVKFDMDIQNNNRTTGAMLSGEVCRLHGEDALGEDSIHVNFKGVAGQSFGCFLARGITFELKGFANDYIGKGMAGGRIVVYPEKGSGSDQDENVVIGNTTFYGATSGEAYIKGVAGERFCIRNSGVNTVVEGVGDHGCEYMTGGRVVVLGETGRNFAAGMSGGIAYIYDKSNSFKKKCNTEMVELEKLEDKDIYTIENLLHNHYKYTGSSSAKEVLDNFSNEIKKFIKVMPIEYKRVLEAEKMENRLDLAESSDG